MLYTITKEFKVDLAHRIFNQDLDDRMSENSANKCRNCHGHSASIKLHLSAPVLNRQGMVLDFNNLKIFKSWLDKYFDHKLVLYVDDPWVNLLFPRLSQDLLQRLRKGEVDVLDDVSFYGEDIYDISENKVKLSADEQEWYHSLTLIPVPTSSEHLCKYLHKIANKILRTPHCKYIVSAVEYSETDSSNSIYQSNE